VLALLQAEAGNRTNRSYVATLAFCQEGLRTGLGAEEVGRSTTSAVVKSIFLVVMVDLVFTALFYINAKS